MHPCACHFSYKFYFYIETEKNFLYFADPEGNWKKVVRGVGK